MDDEQRIRLERGELPPELRPPEEEGIGPRFLWIVVVIAMITAGIFFVAGKADEIGDLIDDIEREIEKLDEVDEPEPFTFTTPGVTIPLPSPRPIRTPVFVSRPGDRRSLFRSGELARAVSKLRRELRPGERLSGAYVIASLANFTVRRGGRQRSFHFRAGAELMASPAISTGASIPTFSVRALRAAAPRRIYRRARAAVGPLRNLVTTLQAPSPGQSRPRWFVSATGRRGTVVFRTDTSGRTVEVLSGNLGG